MKVKSATVTLCKRALYESVSTDVMCRFVKIFNHNYDIYERSGIPRNIPITNQAAAHQIVSDLVQENRFVDFIEILIKVHAEGYMGRKYTIKHLRMLIKNLEKEGFTFDESSGQFFENAKERASANWGRLFDGDERTAALLRLDIVDNSGLVRDEKRKNIDTAYANLRTIVEQAVLSRAGRIWSWEGDGALAAFMFGKKERSALMAGIEILNELFFYNAFSSPLERSIKVRIAAHLGPLQYRSNMYELVKNQLVHETITLEETATAVNSFTISSSLFMYIDRVMQDLFAEKKHAQFGKIRYYDIAME